MEKKAVKSKCIDWKAERAYMCKKREPKLDAEICFEIFYKNCWIIQKNRIFAEKYGMKRNKTKLK